MLAVPAAMPVTIPEDEPMVALEVLLLVHIPPASASVKFVVNPRQTEAVPEIEAGSEFMVMTALPSGPQQPAADNARK